MSVTQPFEIAQLGNPILRQLAAPLTPSQFKEYAPFFAALEKKMLDHNGVGIAAPQVSESVRAFIVASSPQCALPQCSSHGANPDA